MVLIAPVVLPEDGLIYSNDKVKLKIGEKIIGKGVMYISQNSLSWQPEHNLDGICISWKQVSLHGISTNPTKCIYFMLDHKIHWRGVYEGAYNAAGTANGNAVDAAVGDDNARRNSEVDEGNATDEEDCDSDTDVDGSEDEQMTECWLLPDDVNTVETIFQAMTDCQALHPDSADSVSDESDFMDDNDGEDNNEDSFDADADDAEGNMQNLNLNNERFTDADE